MPNNNQRKRLQCALTLSLALTLVYSQAALSANSSSKTTELKFPSSAEQSGTAVSSTQSELTPTTPGEGLVNKTVDKIDSKNQNVDSEVSTPADQTDNADSIYEIDPTKSVDELIELADAACTAKEFSRAEQLYKAADNKIIGPERSSQRTFDLVSKLASLYNKQDRLEETIRELDRATLIAQGLPDSESKGNLQLKTQIRLAKTLYNAELPKRALIEANSAWSICEAQGVSDPLLKAQVLCILSRIQMKNGFLKESAANTEKALLLVSPLCPATIGKLPATPSAPPLKITPELKKALICKAELLAYKAGLQKYTVSVKESDADKLAEEAFRIFQAAGTKSSESPVYFELSTSIQLDKNESATTEALIQKLLDKTIKECGANSLETVHVIEKLARYQLQRNRFDKSLANVARAMKIADRLLPANNVKTSDLWSLSAFNHLRLGDNARAASELKKSYDINCEAAGESSSELANSAQSLAVTYMMTDQLKEAESLMLRAFHINDHLYGRKSAKTIDNCSNLGVLYALQSRYKEAIQYVYWGYVATRQLYGEDSTNLATVAGNLGVLYMRSGNLKEAQSLFTKALALEAKRGTFRLDYADATSRMGELLIAQGKVEQGTELLGKSFRIKEKALGLTHKDTYNALRPYYELLRRLGRTEQANALQTRYKVALGNRGKKRT